ncbi:hypothetical protein LC608_31475 [Nostoc sp. XA010]|uniref:hypothetical protein n=1 Tax=Nostoc sp. XA010 TaxID=2780407 RepID=UPI001E3C67AF|nr:hypothetical protein [Nostoc sp. XA010]MCC5661395.1 hypothetical protein [Nostoc sp. XA010]
MARGIGARYHTECIYLQMDLLLPSKQLLSAFSIALMLSARYNSTGKCRAIASLKIDVAR